MALKYHTKVVSCSRNPTKDRLRVGVRRARASIQYNKSRRFSKETRYRTRVRFTITYPIRSRQLRPRPVARTIVGRECGLRTPILAPSSNGTRISCVEGDKDKPSAALSVRPKKDSLTRCPFLFHQTVRNAQTAERLPLSRR